MKWDIDQDAVIWSARVVRKERRQWTRDILQLRSGEEILVGPYHVVAATPVADIAPTTIVVDDVSD